MQRHSFIQQLLRGVFLCAVFTGLGVLNPAEAQIVNGGFETGDYTGWNTAGYSIIETAALGVGPTEGNFQALIATDNIGNQTLPVTAANLETFLGLGAGTLDALTAPDLAFEGSAIKQVFNGEAGLRLLFDWDFLTNETIPPISRDTAFVVINGNVTVLANSSSPLLPTAPPLDLRYAAHTGFQTFEFILPATGTYTLGLGVLDALDGDISSGLVVDRVSLPTPTDVPEPGGVSLLAGIVVFSASLMRRRRQQR